MSKHKKYEKRHKKEHRGHNKEIDLLQIINFINGIDVDKVKEVVTEFKSRTVDSEIEPGGDKKIELANVIRPMLNTENAAVLDKIMQLYEVGKILKQ